MAKADDKVEAIEQASTFPMSLDEFCSEISRDDRRVELIGAFHREEKAARRLKADKSEFMKRYEDFAKKPA